MQFKVPRQVEQDGPVSKVSGFVSKLFVSLFFFVFAGMGIGFIVLMIREVVKGNIQPTLHT